MSKFHFSIIVPVLNESSTITKCIDSIIDQRSNQNKIEIIVIDGGSTDDTVELLKEYSNEINTLISKKGLNQTKAIIKGLHLATGEIVTWLNGDDSYTQDALIKVKESFSREKNVEFIYGNCSYVNERGELLKVNTKNSKYVRELLKYTDFMFSQESCFWRKDAWEKVKMDSEIEYAMDYDIFSSLVTNSSTKYVNKVLAECLVHPNQRHRHKIGDFTIWNIERAKIQKVKFGNESSFKRVFMVLLFFFYKELFVEKRFPYKFCRMYRIINYKPFKT